MSTESEIIARWDATAALVAQIPSDRTFLDAIPSGTATPCAYISFPADPTYEWTSCYALETVPFAVTVFDTSSDDLAALADLVDTAYRFQAVASATVECRPTGRRLVGEEIITQAGERMYSLTLRYNLLSVRNQ